MWVLWLAKKKKKYFKYLALKPECSVLMVIGSHSFESEKYSIYIRIKQDFSFSKNLSFNTNNIQVRILALELPGITLHG